MRRRWVRPLAFAAVAVAAIGANAGLHRAVAHARDRRDDALAAQLEAEARLSDLQHAVAATRVTIRDTAAATSSARVATEAATAETERVAGEAANVRNDLAATGNDAAAATARLELARAGLATASAQVGDLQTCLAGVSAASGAARRGDTASVIAAIQPVAAACRRAQAATEPIDPSAKFPYDFPDPFVVATGGGYFAYATNSSGGAVQLLRSDDLNTWSFAGTALSSVPAWARPGATWAPAVLPRWGYWVLYYAVRDRASGRQCISAATGPGPTGPFVDESTHPLVCELDQGGSIDPSPFVAPDGSVWLLWKSEGETAGGTAAIRSQRLQPDGVTLSGPAATLAVPDQRWEGRTIEGPSMVATPSGLVLLYSANRWDSTAYAVGAARCDTPAGPCHKLPGPVLSSAGPMVGPGGAEAFIDRNGTPRVAFHAWQTDEVGHPNSRYLHIGTISVSAGAMSISIN